MGRFLFSLLIGVVGAAVIVALNLNHRSLVAPLIGLAGGLLLGLVTGWRHPRPGRALGRGLLLGAVMGALMAGGQVYGLARSSESLRLPAWLLDQMDDVTLFQWLVGLTAGACFLFAAGVSGALAGIVSAWSGLRAGVGQPVSRRAVIAPSAPKAPTGLDARAPATPVRATDTGGLLPGPVD
ncbi:MAG TPA: hypothetical protein VF808_01875 [Ktedonobacterales bacterium]